MLVMVLTFGMSVVGCGAAGDDSGPITKLVVVNNSSSTYAMTAKKPGNDGKLTPFSIVGAGGRTRFSLSSEHENGTFTIRYHQYNGTLKTDPNDNDIRIFYVPEGEEREVNLFY